MQFNCIRKTVHAGTVEAERMTERDKTMENLHQRLKERMDSPASTVLVAIKQLETVRQIFIMFPQETSSSAAVEFFMIYHSSERI